MARVDDLLEWIKQPDAERCVCCAGISRAPAILDDGDPVCIPCIEQGAHAAAHPEALSETEMLLIEQMHGDVVTLEPRIAWPGLYWRWTSKWPKSERV